MAASLITEAGRYLGVQSQAGLQNVFQASQKDIVRWYLKQNNNNKVYKVSNHYVIRNK